MYLLPYFFFYCYSVCAPAFLERGEREGVCLHACEGECPPFWGLYCVCEEMRGWYRKPASKDENQNQNQHKYAVSLGELTQHTHAHTRTPYTHGPCKSSGPATRLSSATGAAHQRDGRRTLSPNKKRETHHFYGRPSPVRRLPPAGCGRRRASGRVPAVRPARPPHKTVSQPPGGRGGRGGRRPAARGWWRSRRRGRRGRACRGRGSGSRGGRDGRRGRGGGRGDGRAGGPVVGLGAVVRL